MWNVAGNFDVEYGGERWCEIWWITLMWNAPENGDVEYGGERWCWGATRNPLIINS